MMALLFALLLLLLALGGWLYGIGRRYQVTDWGHAWVNLIDGINRYFCRHYHRLPPFGLELPETGPALVAANHLSGLDPLLMVASCRRPLRFIIAKEQYHRFGLHWLFRAVGCIPVDRKGAPEKALREAWRALERGEVVALFPHGRIHLDSDPPRRLKPGVARLAQLTGAPVYPLRLDGIRGAGQVIAAVFRRSRVRLRPSPPVYCAKGEEAQCLEQLQQFLDTPSSEGGAD